MSVDLFCKGPFGPQRRGILVVALLGHKIFRKGDIVKGVDPVLADKVLREYPGVFEVHTPPPPPAKVEAPRPNKMAKPAFKKSADDDLLID